MTETRVGVHPQDGDSYEVVIGAHLHAVIMAELASPSLLVYPTALRAAAGELTEALSAAGQTVTGCEVPDGEAAKSLPVAERVYDRAAAAGLDRDATVVGFGGGSVTDLAGYVAATWMRGVRLVQLPTTLLAMVDAAVGGKTGLNLTAGKNLVGVFHQPAAVVCDLTWLDTLPAVELRSGLAEVIKCGFIADPGLLALLTDLETAGRNLAELVARAVAVKARFVGQDTRDQGSREFLNYGHTLGHAIERVEGYRWRHGDAVSVGMVFAAELAHRSALLDTELVDAHRRTLTAVGLPVSYHQVPWRLLRTAMAADKKARAGRLRFVVLAGLAQPQPLDDPPEDVLAACYAALGG